MTLLAAVGRLCVAIVALAGFSVATVAPRPWGSLAWGACIALFVYAVGCAWQCQRIADNRPH